jgi:hypothetical protein
MVQINFARKEVNCKIVYYGCGLSGKTTNLEVVHEKAPADRKGELTSIATEGDRTLFFDFMPLELGKVGGMNTKFQLYTVPGQVYYNATRKLVLQGADGVIFVVDSQREKLQENIESFQNLTENLKEQGLDIKKIPLVIQYNKRDLPGALPVAELERELNTLGAPYFEAIAVTGEGVFPTLKKLSSMVLDSLNKQYGVGGKGAPAAPPPKAAEAKKVESGEIPSNKPAPRPPPREEPAPAAKREAGKVSKVSALEAGGGGRGGARDRDRERPPERPPERVPAAAARGGRGGETGELRRGGERQEADRPLDGGRRGRGAGEPGTDPGLRRERTQHHEEERPRPRGEGRMGPAPAAAAGGGGGTPWAIYGVVGLLLVVIGALLATGKFTMILEKVMGK